MLRHYACYLAAFGIVLCSQVVSAAEALPAFSKVEAVVRRHFRNFPEHRPRDLISRTQVEPVFRQIEQLGWPVAKRAAILNSVLPDTNYLVRQFRTPKGERFMREISRYSLAYDRLDQISRLPNGKLMVNDFLRFPNSELTLSKQSSLDISKIARLQPNRGRGETPKAEDFNKPSGRIYTVEDLLVRLKASYQVELTQRKKN